MATNFPTALDDGTSIPNPTGTNTQNSPDHASLHSSTGDGLKAVEAKLGIGASTPVINRLLFGTGTGTSAWTAITSAQLAATLSDETGSGSAVFATTPTLVTPKVDTINENTATNGVTIDGLNIKDAALNTNNSVVTTNITDANVTAPKMNNSGTWNSSWAWQSWSPTYANITVNNGTAVAKYTQIGKTVYAEVSITAGTTTSFANSITISQPVTANSRYGTDANGIALGTCTAVDTGTASYSGWVRSNASVSSVMIRWNDGTAATSVTFPFAEGAADNFSAQWVYEAA